MAVYWNLGLVTRTSDEADACADFFSRRALFVAGEHVPLEVWRAKGPDGWLVGVWPSGMSHASPKGDDPRLLDGAARMQIATSFDQWLLDAPPFKAAYFGGEAFDRFLSEPIAEIIGVEGLVLDEATWSSLGAPTEAHHAGAGRYYWPRSRAP